jgi:hypothetical protein
VTYKFSAVRKGLTHNPQAVCSAGAGRADAALLYSAGTTIKGTELQLTKTFSSTRFSSTVVGEAVEAMEALSGETEATERAEFEKRQAEKTNKASFKPRYSYMSLSTSRENETWSFDTIDEWYAAYERGATGASLRIVRDSYAMDFTLQVHSMSSAVSITAPTTQKVERLMRYFNVAEVDSKLPELPAVEAAPIPVVVFIGHGRSSDWRDIRPTK